MMSTVLGMVMMMPVVFGVGGYVLVNRRAWPREDDDVPPATASHCQTRIHLMVRR
jgi:hypothetical protein